MNVVSPLALINGRIQELASIDQLKTSINQLFDVEAESAVDGDILIYNSNEQIWKNATVPEIIAHRHISDDISNEVLNSTASEIDFVSVDTIDIVKWLYSVSLISDPASKEIGEITATHDGTPLLDATDVSFSKFAEFETGTGIPNLSVNVFLFGAGITQKMSLVISCPEPINIRSLRIHVDPKEGNSRWINGEFADNTPYIPRLYDAGGA